MNSLPECSLKELVAILDKISHSESDATLAPDLRRRIVELLEVRLIDGERLRGYVTILQEVLKKNPRSEKWLHDGEFEMVLKGGLATLFDISLVQLALSPHSLLGLHAVVDDNDVPPERMEYWAALKARAANLQIW